jgi:hypothetical protein
MTRSDPDRPDGSDGSARLDADDRPSGTRTGADATSRMSGTHRDDDAHDAKHDAKHDVNRDNRDSVAATREDSGHGTVDTDDRYEERVVPTKYKSAKTSAAAVFSLVFGLAALFCALTFILSPVAVLFGLIGLILGIIGLKKAKLVGVTGKGVAIGGLVTAVLGLLLGGAIVAGSAAFLSDEGRVGELRTQIDDFIDDAPSTGEVIDSVPGTE